MCSFHLSIHRHDSSWPSLRHLCRGEPRGAAPARPFSLTPTCRLPFSLTPHLLFITVVAASEWPASFHKEQVNKGTQLCGHEGSGPFPAASTAPTSPAEEDPVPETGTNSSSVSWARRTPAWGKFCSFLFLSTVKNFLCAKDTLVESEQTPSLTPDGSLHT